MSFSRQDVLERFRAFEAVLREGEQAPTVYRGGVSVTRIEPGQSPHDPQYTARVERSAKELLALADVTDGLRAYVLENVMGAYHLGIPPQHVVEALGIDPERGEFGYFDPEQAERVEREMQKAALGAELLGPRAEALEDWSRQIEEKYPAA